MTQEIRWHYRFENFSRALDFVKNAVGIRRAVK